MVQTAVPAANDFHQTDLVLDGPAIRRKYRNHLSAALASAPHTGAFHKFSPKYLDRYEIEFAGRHNLCESNKPHPMGTFVRDTYGRRLRYDDPIR